jgi:hypothetical protein
MLCGHYGFKILVRLLLKHLCAENQNEKVKKLKSEKVENFFTSQPQTPIIHLSSTICYLEVRVMPIYMKFEGIKGPVTGKYADWIELQTCQMGGMRNNGNVVGVVTEIVVTKYHDSSSAALFEASLSGEGKKVKIDFVKGDAPFLSLELEKTLILR